MHPSLRLIEEAIAIAKEEEQALLDSNFDQVEALCEKRSSIEKEAWDKRDGCEESELLVFYKRLQAVQLRLEQIVKEDFVSVKDSLEAIKKQNQYFSSKNKRSYGDNKIRMFSKNL